MRKKGIGGTDISAILGMNPHKTALDVWLDKTGQAEPQEDNENMWWGREMEPVIAKRYEKETGIQLLIPAYDRESIVLPGKPVICGRPDALKFEHGFIKWTPGPPEAHAEGGVDFKTSGRPQDWGEPGTDDAPRQYIIQAEWYMGLTGAQWWDLAVLLMSFTRKFAIYRINRDEDLIGYLQEEAEKFWKDHILSGIPPTLDGSKSASDYLKRKYQVDSGPMLEPTDFEILAEIKSYQYALGNLKHQEKEVSLLENNLKDIVGDCAGIQGEWGRITWKRSKDSQSVDWKEAFKRVVNLYDMDPAEMDAIMAQHTTIKPGSRRWLPKFKED